MAYKDQQKAKEYARKWKQENKEKVCAQSKRYAEKHPEKIKSIGKAYREVNREAINARSREWHKNNKESQKEYRKEYEARNKGAIKEKIALRYWSDPETSKAAVNEWRKKNPDKLIASKKKWDAANIEHCEAYRKEYWQKNKDKIAADSKRWREKNKEKVREYSQKRRADQMGSDGTVTAAEIEALWDRQDGKCAYFYACGSMLGSGIRGAHRDHIDPLTPKDKSAAPGRHTISNIQLLCGSCNSRKRNNDAYTFTQQHEGRLFPDLPRDPQAPAKKSAKKKVR